MHTIYFFLSSSIMQNSADAAASSNDRNETVYGGDELVEMLQEVCVWCVHACARMCVWGVLSWFWLSLCYRVHMYMSCSPSWSTLGVLLVAITMPTSSNVSRSVPGIISLSLFRSFSDRRWYSFNDQSVTRVCVQTLLTCCCMMCFMH